MRSFRPIHAMTWLWRIFLLLAAASLCQNPTANAQVVGKIATDGTLGARQTFAGPVYLIPASAGRQVGNNLFHSFSDFSIGTGETASFSGPDGIANVIARVTGGGVSQIDGTIQCTIPNANFYLINPAGVVFGPNAALDVKGSFAVSTADYLKLGADGRFDARDPSRDVLTTSPPAAFGFLDVVPARIAVSGATLRIPEGAVLTIVSGGITLAPSEGASSGAEIDAPSGRVNLVSIASPGEAVLDASAPDSVPDVSSFSQLGDVQMMNAVIRGDGTVGGGITLRADILSMNASLISSSTGGGQNGRDVHLDVTGEINMTGSSLLTGTSSDGGGGNISISTGVLTLTANSLIQTSTSAAGASGSISIESVRMSMTDSLVSNISTGSGIAGSATIHVVNDLTIVGNSTGDHEPAGIGGNFSMLSAAHGSNGSVNIAAGSLSLNSANLTTETYGTNAAGDVSIAVAGPMTVQGGNIAARSHAAGNSGSIFISAASLIEDSCDITAEANEQGNAGSVHLDIQGLLQLNGVNQHGSIDSSTFGEASDSGTAGDVIIHAGQLQMLGEGQIQSLSFGASGAGNVEIYLTGDLTMKSTHTDWPYISAQARSSKGGDVTIEAANLDIIGGGEIQTDAVEGTGGDIKILLTGTLRLDDRITSSRSNFEPLVTATGVNGGGGNIFIHAASVELFGTNISTSTSGTGPSGTISIDSSEAVKLATVDLINFSDEHVVLGSHITASSDLQTPGGGPAGDIEISAGSIDISHRSTVGSITQGTGKGGNVTLRADRNIVIRGRNDVTATGVFANSLSTGPGSGGGGNINLLAGGDVTIFLASIAASSAASDGGNISMNSQDVIFIHHSTITGSAALTGGQILIDPTLVVLNDHSIINGQAGGQDVHVIINADELLVSQDSQILTDKGTFTIDTQLASGLSRLLASLTLPIQLQDSCFARYATSNISTFTVASQGGLAIVPAGSLPGLDVGPAPTSNDRHGQSP